MATNEETLKKILNLLPETLALRAFPGETFRANAATSYVATDGAVYLCIQRRVGERWLDFTKGTIAELLTELATRDAKKLRAYVRETKVYPTVEALVAEAANRWTIENLGGDWVEQGRWQEMVPGEGEFPDCSEWREAERGVLAEHREWTRHATKLVKLVVKAGRPLSIESMEDAFHKRGVFAETKPAKKAKAGGPPKTVARKRAVAK